MAPSVLLQEGVRGKSRELMSDQLVPFSPPHSPPRRRSPQMRRLITCKWTRRRRRRCRAPCRSGLMCGSPRSLPRARSSSGCGRQQNRQCPVGFPQLRPHWAARSTWAGFLELVCGGEGVSLVFFSLKTKQNLISGEDLADTVCQ